MKEYFQHLQAAERELLSEVKTVLQLILLMPATNAASERSFSAMRRVKSYLRSTTVADPGFSKRGCNGCWEVVYQKGTIV